MLRYFRVINEIVDLPGLTNDPAGLRARREKLRNERMELETEILAIVKGMPIEPSPPA